MKIGLYPQSPKGLRFFVLAMSTLRPFFLSSLALHLLGVGLLLFWMINSPAAPKEEVKILTVTLVSPDPFAGGSARGVIKGERALAFGSGDFSSPVMPGKTATEPSPSRLVSPSALEPEQKPEAPSIVISSPQTPVQAGATVASGGEGSSGRETSTGRGNSPGAGGAQITSLPGNGAGQGSGIGFGNGWSPGVDGRFYLKGGYQVTPAYPPSARRQGREGTTYLKIKISPEGKVLEVLVDQSSGHRDLDEAAMEAVKTWCFEPPMKGEQRVSLWARVPVKFQLRK